MLRHFIAIEPPADQRERIADVMGQLGDPWPVPHITLKSPLGLTPDLAWLPAVREVATRSPHQHVRLGPLGTFDHRVVYLSVEGDGLESLHLALIEAVRDSVASGPSLVERPFVAHLTLSVARPDAVLTDYTRLCAPLADLGDFEASALTVFQREEPHTHYRAWAELPLRG